MTYKEACEYFNTIGNSSSVKSNEYIARCLRRLGNPEEKAGLLIHVAGTNGKGSVCAFLASVLTGAGIRTGRFTSPHLVRINERIAVDGEMIPDEDFLWAFEKVRKMAEGMERSPAYFEYTFLMAMLYFAKQGVEAAVIEVGIGGRLDATNVIAKPGLTVITSVGLDHTEYLGDTVAKVAAEKAGIMKAGAPCVYDASDAEAAEVIRRRAEELGVCGYPLKAEDYRIAEIGKSRIVFYYKGRERYEIRACAPYQAANAALAVLSCHVLEETGRLPKEISEEQLEEGLLRMSWPARMEEIEPGVYLDGAHNPHGIKRFLEAVRGICGEAAGHLLFGVMKDKEYGEMIRLLTGFNWKSVTVTQAEGTRGLVCEAAAEIFCREGASDVRAEREFEAAYREVLRRRSQGEYVFVCGSLFLAGMCKDYIARSLKHD